ncbi:MAG: AAA family ATPase [Candidatus Desulfofervidaceae bacterium]|nr:AAA family ATPase [Candidatus Desulfofervidaceae bacterium]
MWIKRLVLKNFGVFTDHTFSFKPGLNIIYGPNEAGKSTIFDAIESAFFRRIKSKRRYKGEVKLWLVLPEGEEIEVKKQRPAWLKTVDLELFENIYFVRTGEIEFVKETQFLENLKAKLLNVSGLYEAKNRLVSALGKSLKSLGERYTRAGELNQELEATERMLKELQTKKEEYLEIRHLEKKRQELEEERKRLEEERAILVQKQKLITQTHQKRTLLERYKQCQQALQVKQDIIALEQKLASLAAFTEEDGTRLEKLQEEQKSLHQEAIYLEQQSNEIKNQLEDKKERLKTLEQEKRTYDLEQEKRLLHAKQYAQFNQEDAQKLLNLTEKKTYLADAKEKAATKLKTYKQQLTTLTESLTQAETQLAHTQKAYKGCRWQVGLGGSLLLISLVAAFWQPWTLVGAGIGIGWMILWGYKWKRLKQTLNRYQKEIEHCKLQLELEDTHLNTLEQEIEKYISEIENITQTINQMCQQVGVVDIAAYQAALKEKTSIEKELQRLGQQLEMLDKQILAFKEEIKAEGKRYQILRAKQKTCANKLKAVEREIVQILNQVGVSAISIFFNQLEEKKHLQAQLKALENRLPSFDPKEEMAVLERKLAQFKDVPDKIAGADKTETTLEEVQSRLENITNEIGTLQGIIKEKLQTLGQSEAEVLNQLYQVETAYEALKTERQEWLLVYKVLLEMERRVEKQLLHILEKQASDWFSFITQGQYDGLSFQDGHLFARKGKEICGVEALSTGTKDQLYLAARLAMAQEMAKNRFFLLLDDPFLTCDKERTMRLLAVLKEFSQRCQILLATKDEWLKEQASKEANVIELTPLTQ